MSYILHGVMRNSGHRYVVRLYLHIVILQAEIGDEIENSGR